MKTIKYDVISVLGAVTKPVKIKIGEKIRVVVYLEGKKHYFFINLQSYKKAHGTDVRRKAKGEE